MSSRFPRVGVIGAGPFSRALVAPAAALGIDLLLFAGDKEDSAAQIAAHIVGDHRNLTEVLDFARKCDLITFEHDEVPLSVIRGIEAEGIKVYPSSSALMFSRNQDALRANHQPFFSAEAPSECDAEIAVMVARSPHGQATSWAPVEVISEDGICTMTIAPAQGVTSTVAEKAQQIALEIAQAVGVVGVMTVQLLVSGEDLFIKNLSMRFHETGNWSAEGSVTSQFEQQLRAILDLPLGSPAMNYPFTVTGNVLAGDKSDMYRPYLHLMARMPTLHFHQYRTAIRPGEKSGHITACGGDLQYLIEEIEHARDYMSGVIEE